MDALVSEMTKGRVATVSKLSSIVSHWNNSFLVTAMLGVVGYLTTYAGVRLPGLEDVPAGWAAWKALPDEVVGQMGMAWILMEMANRDQTGNGEFIGDFRNGYLDFGWDSQSDDWKKNKRTIELNQGRAAQMGLAGLMIHDAMGNVADILPLAAK